MITRDSIQESGSNLGVKHKLITIELPTGTGKGKLCMMIIDKCKSDRKWLIVVPELIQIENMKNDIKKHGYEHLYNTKIEDIICYASLGKYAGKKLNLHLNECHRLSELKEDIAQTIDYERIIADSATIPSSVRDRLYSLGDFYEYKMTLQEVIDAGVLATPTFFVSYIDLDDKIKRNSYAKFHNLTDRQYMDLLEKDLSYWVQRAAVERSPIWIVNRLNQIGLQRKKFIAKCKTQRAKEIMNYLNGKRVLCYAGSIEQCDELGKDRAIHSEKTKKHNLQILNSFNNKEIDDIYMNKMGREGLNLTDIDAVVLVQLGSGKDEGLELVQKIGRGLRSLNPEIYLIVCRETIDEKFYYKAKEKIDNENIVKLEF